MNESMQDVSSDDTESIESISETFSSAESEDEDPDFVESLWDFVGTFRGAIDDCFTNFALELCPNGLTWAFLAAVDHFADLVLTGLDGTPRPIIRHPGSPEGEQVRFGVEEAREAYRLSGLERYVLTLASYSREEFEMFEYHVRAHASMFAMRWLWVSNRTGCVPEE